ncbi:hypothetical protein JXM67_03090 [candidate division WOR-3 bacterium]|nr:hypothetical protein [candidate division WOR-3 bacterium]
MYKNIPKRVLLFLIGFTYCGCCGYSTRSLLPTYIKTINIAEVKNRTLHPLLAEDLNDRLVTAFTRDGRLRVSPDPSADLVLIIEITGYKRSAAVYDDSHNVSEWRYELRYSGNCTDQLKNNVLWEGTQQVFEVIDADVDEEDGIEQLLKSAADLIVQNILVAW